MNQNNSLALILAAGQGTRMKSNIPKPLMEVNGHPMIFWLINDFKKNNIDVTLIINPSDEAIFKEKINNVNFVFQKNPKGTGHAVIQAKNNFKNYKYIYVFVGDCPFVGSKNIAMMYQEHIKTYSDLTILSSVFKNKKFPYARIIPFVSSYFDIAKSVLGDSQTEYTWLLSSKVDYSNFDFNYIPEQHQAKQLHVWNNKNQKEGDTFLFPKCFLVPEFLLVHVFPSDEVRTVPVKPTATNVLLP